MERFIGNFRVQQDAPGRFKFLFDHASLKICRIGPDAPPRFSYATEQYAEVVSHLNIPGELSGFVLLLDELVWGIGFLKKHL